MTLVADSAGVVLGKFQIPAGVKAGAKEVTFTGGSGATATAAFFGEGVEITDTRTRVTTTEVARWPASVDPIAQTFTLTESMQLDGVELYVAVKGTTPIAVQIRETQVGYPILSVIADARLDPSQVSVGWNKFTFLSPAMLDANVEYAIVALCNDSVAELGVAELGKFDATAQQWVTSQPYTVGVLLSSSNASTWTAHQDRDLSFRLLAREYTQAERLIDLGSVSIVDATELLLLTMIDNPSSDANGEIELTMPDGTVVRAGDRQVIRFGAKTTGTVGVKARLRATTYQSATLLPGTMVVGGQAQASSIYISNATDADAAGSQVKVTFDAVVPSGATVVAEVSGVDVGDAWLPMSAIGVPKLIDGDIGLYEFRFERSSVMEARVRVRLTLNGTPSQRPRVRNLQVVVL